MKGIISHVRSDSSVAIARDRKRDHINPILEKLDFNINYSLSL
jgi:hypothetical protein